MPDLTARLDLPLIKPSQAQKHVTHNEALQLLDGLVQATLEEVGAETPPFEPVTGQLFALGANPTGDWAGEGGKLALRIEEAWLFIAPQAGWRAWDKAAGRLVVHDAAQGWVEVVPELNNLDGVGIGTIWDATNRLAVSSDAVLFSHAGAGHQLKINKAAASDTASLLFQSNWTGHAEMGLAGDTAFSIKVSDGSTWYDAIKADATAQKITLSLPVDLTGNATVTGNLTVSGVVSGNAVQSSAYDATAGKLLKVGAFGLGDIWLLPPGGNISVTDNSIPPGFYRYDALIGNTGGPAGVNRGSLMHSRRTPGGGETQLMVVEGATGSGAKAGDVWTRSRVTSTWTPWARGYNSQNLLGTVSQSAGVPTGAVIESGSNANGSYVRFANGTQVCSTTKAASSTAATTWTFPAAFAAAPVVKATPVATVLSGGVLDAAPTTTAVTFSARDKTDARRADTVHLEARGRWF